MSVGNLNSFYRVKIQDGGMENRFSSQA